MRQGTIDAIERLLVSRPFGDSAPVLIRSSDRDDDAFDARFQSEGSDDLIVAIVDAAIETEHGDSERDVMTATLGILASVETGGGSEWGTFARLHSHFRRIIRDDPTIGGRVIEAEIGDATTDDDAFNSPRTRLVTTLIVRYEE